MVACGDWLTMVVDGMLKRLRWLRSFAVVE